MPNYTLSDSETVKNKLGALSHDELEAKEVAWVAGRQVEHSLNPQIPRTFDAAHLKVSVSPTPRSWLTVRCILDFR